MTTSYRQSGFGQPQDSASCNDDTVSAVLPSIGDNIDRMRVLSQIATGGMAIVYKVHHEDLEVTRAVKLLKPDCPDEFRSRLQTEAKISAHLQHANIVQIYDIGAWNGSAPYIEMEYVDGTSLDKLIEKNRPLPLAFCLAVASIICRALSHAQAQHFTLYGKVYSGLVHRDIKPANILISREGVVKLADFGIAQAGNVSLHTVGENILGTYAYLSPEQLNGIKADPRTDIYSLGVVLYEMIAGQKAFPEKKIGELIRNKLKGIARPLQMVMPATPPAVLQIVEQCVHIERDRRFASAEECGEALDYALRRVTPLSAEEVVRTFRSNTGEIPSIRTPLPAAKRLQRLVPYLFAILPGLVLLGLIVAGLLRLRGGGEEPPARDWARDAVMRPVDDRNVQKSPDTPENTSQEVSDAEPAEPSHSRTSPVVSEQKAPDRKKVKTTAVSRPAKPASGKERAATSLLEKGREAIRRESYPEAVALFQKASGKPAMEREARIRLVEAYVRNGESRKAILHYQERPIEDGYCQLWLGHAYHRVGDFQSAEKAYQRASKSSSAVSRGVRVDALFALADTREAMFMRQPNATNRALMVRAWEAFQRAACGKQNADKRCAEAAQRSARLSR